MLTGRISVILSDGSLLTDLFNQSYSTPEKWWIDHRRILCSPILSLLNRTKFDNISKNTALSYKWENEEGEIHSQRLHQFIYYKMVIKNTPFFIANRHNWLFQNYTISIFCCPIIILWILPSFLPLLHWMQLSFHLRQPFGDRLDTLIGLIKIL